jgi:hypothetical protein
MRTCGMLGERHIRHLELLLACKSIFHYFIVFDYKFCLYRAFAHDVTAAMLVFQFKIILIRLFCPEHQHAAMTFVELLPGE